jgi:multisubunit Na+/H+ antiporter MnhG subunit
LDKLAPLNDEANTTWLRLTALWALAETALGGLLHALHIPLTGYLVGGIAMLCIGLIARQSNSPAKDLMKSLLLVLILKAGISPHSPPAAYVAVCFQAIWASFIYGFLRFNLFSALLFIIPSMLESAFQKLLMLTIIYSMKFWEAIDNFGEWLASLFNSQFTDSLSYWLILLYGLSYVIWGVLLSYWLIKLPQLIETRKNRVIELTQGEQIMTPPKSKRKNTKRVLFFMLLLLTMVFLVFFQKEGSAWLEALYVLIRSLLIVSFLLLLQPVLVRLIRKWTLKKRANLDKEIETLQKEVSRIRALAYPLYKKLKSEYRGLRLLVEWVSHLFVLTLYPVTDEN